MKSSLGILLMLTLPICCNAQTKPENIPPSRLQAILDSPDEGVAQRETYKVPLKSAYERQMGLSKKDCHAEADQGQQPYNICMGNAEQQADKDYATFYNNLQLLCHDQDQLKALQSSEQAWRIYLDAMEKAAHAAWSEGSGASGFASEAYVLLVRSRMNELYKIYGLNISQ